MGRLRAGVAALILVAGVGSAASCSSELTIVQSIPVGDFDTPALDGSVPTWAVFTGMAANASATLDVTAMYMDLLATADRQLYKPADMQGFGAQRGADLMEALRGAAQRGVNIRLLLGTLNRPIESPEVLELLQYPNVNASEWDATQWYGGGIMHNKMWIRDGRDVYIGSANCDWKSLTQVKEVGVQISACKDGTASVAEAARLFEVLWAWSWLPSAAPAQLFDVPLQASLTVPPWDVRLPVTERQPPPFDRNLDAQYNAARPFPVAATEPATGFLSASPPGAETGLRMSDLDAMLYTLRDANASISMSVMDFLPGSGGSGGHGGAAVRWSTLTDAILAIVTHKNVRVRLLVSHWAHTSPQQVAAMKELQNGLAACNNAYQACAGTLEVKEYFVPKWDSTSDARMKVVGAYPSFTRVNHAKYIVTDRRANIGTNNWQWGYFAQTAGCSFNTNDTSIVQSLEGVFQLDWDSPYATSVQVAPETGSDWPRATVAGVASMLVMVASAVGAAVGYIVGLRNTRLDSYHQL